MTRFAKYFFVCLALITAGVYPQSAHSGDVEILDVSARKSGDTWSFSVTLKHADTGWDHYANLWQVYSPDNELLGERVLHHPHVQEQPFTRSLSGVEIPADVSEVYIRARDSVHGVASESYKVELSR